MKKIAKYFAIFYCVLLTKTELMSLFGLEAWNRLNASEADMWRTFFLMPLTTTISFLSFFSRRHFSVESFIPSSIFCI